MKLQESKGKYSIFLPTRIVEGFSWKKGQELEVKILGKDRLEIRKRPLRTQES
ncbi:MAG: hypothetical protein V1921_04830 [Candidatus Altiarchaeota archaeon]